jgi:glucoamylase
MTSSSSLSLKDWGERQARISAERMALSVSATGLMKRRAGFRQIVRPAKGSVLAAPAITDAPPDYFFHWLRDAAVVMDAALVLIRQGGETADLWRRHFEDYVDFSLKLWELNGPVFQPKLAAIRERTAPDLAQYIRQDAEIAAIDSDCVAGDVRFNADGTLDFLNWNRPQHDGIATRALGAMRFWDMDASSSGEARARLAALIRADLDYTDNHADEPCIEIWEEEHALHYYTLLVQLAALQEGARWMEMQDEEEQATYLTARAAPLPAILDGFWSPEAEFYRSRIFPDGRTSPKDPDMSVILGVLHAGLLEGPHSVLDPKALATLTAAESYFAGALAINKSAGEGTGGAAFGRYQGDTYFNGGAWFPCTFAAAEFHYRLAAAENANTAEHFAKGDAILARARQFIPESGELPEQFDRDTGAPLSAHDLSWSYAAFLTAWDARESAKLSLERP